MKDHSAVPEPDRDTDPIAALCRATGRYCTTATSTARRATAEDDTDQPRHALHRSVAAAARILPAPVKSSRALRLARRSPGLAAWLLVFLGMGLWFATPDLTAPRLEDEPLRYQRWLEKRGHSAVRATLARIGTHVDISDVRAGPYDPWILGAYWRRENAIEFNSDIEYEETELLEVAAHECVHAIINQHSFQPYSSTHGDYYSLVNETAAYVLGAHIAGDVWRRKGHDGHALTGTLIFLHRDACDPAIPNSVYNRFLAPGQPDSGRFTREMWHGVLIHFAPVELVDAVDTICCRHTDPTDAARAICERFMRADPSDPRDRRILEEFERRQARW